MSEKKPNGFDRYFDRKMADPAFAKAYRNERRHIDAIDRATRDIIQTIDRARKDRGLSKAALARKVNLKEEVVRRLLTADGYNPTLATVLRLANALHIKKLNLHSMLSEEHYAATESEIPRRAS